ncbi:MAG: hypothetical protein AAFW97_14540 [Pseudomonadota bacterium]
MPTLREYRDEIEAAIDAGKTLAQIRSSLKRQGVNKKLQRRLGRLAGTALQRRDLARAEGKSFAIDVVTSKGTATGTVTILDVGFDRGYDDALRVTFEVRRPNGKVFHLRPGKSTTTVVRQGVPTNVPDGLVANPDFEPDEPSSQPEIMSYREDMRAAAKEWIRQTVQSAIERRGL